MPTMEIAYELTQDDFTEAYTAHRKRSATAKIVQLVLFGIFIAFASLALFRAVRAHNTMVLLPYFLFAILWILVVGTFIPRWLVRRQFTKQPGAHGPRKLLLDASGAHWRWNGGSADVEWRNYIRSVEGTNQILLYTSPSGFNILPSRALKPDQLSGLRAMLQQNIRGNAN